MLSSSHPTKINKTKNQIETQQHAAFPLFHILVITIHTTMHWPKSEIHLQCLLGHMLHKSYFSSWPQILNKWGKCCDPSEYRGKPYSLYVGEQLMRKPLTRACFVLWLPASSQFICLPGRLYSGRQSWAMGRGQCEETQTS